MRKYANVVDISKARNQDVNADDVDKVEDISNILKAIRDDDVKMILLTAVSESYKVLATKSG